MDIPLIVNDPWLEPFADTIKNRSDKAKHKEKELTKGEKLSDFANAYNYYGLHKTPKEWIYKDSLPNAAEVFLIGEFSEWHLKDEFKLVKKENGEFEIKLKLNTLKHLDLYRLFIRWQDWLTGIRRIQGVMLFK